MDPKNAPAVSATPTTSPNSQPSSTNPVDRFKNLSGKKKLLLGIAALILIVLVGIFIYSWQNKVESSKITIAKVGDTSLPQSYFDYELSYFPATESAQVKDMLIQKIIDDEVTL